VAKLNSTGTALVYATFLGNCGSSAGPAIAVDSSGNVYVTGITCVNVPTSAGAFQTTLKGTADAFVLKLNSSGTALIYSTYVGGSNGFNGIDFGSSIAIDSSGNAYITGGTLSGDFPTTAGAFQTTFQGTLGSSTDAFATKVNPTGTALVYSTFLSGSTGGFQTLGNGIAVDSSGNAYVAGSTSTTNFPTTPGAFQTTFGGGGGAGDAFVTKLNPTGTALVYSTYLGGLGSDEAFGITLSYPIPVPQAPCFWRSRALRVYRLQPVAPDTALPADRHSLSPSRTPERATSQAASINHHAPRWSYSPPHFLPLAFA
jgi:hypothetical protein